MRDLRTRLALAFLVLVGVTVAGALTSALHRLFMYDILVSPVRVCYVYALAYARTLMRNEESHAHP